MVVSVNETVVAASELQAAMKRIKLLAIDLKLCVNI